ncbi:MAG: transcription termination factor NusA [Oscillospiraceae bacterium]|jgi:N utilization substance protein A|nr:transcription termination factor NusA [Oscillospiraceae bacterium]
MYEDVFNALEQLESERNIPKTYMLEKLQQALLKAVKEQMKKDGNPLAAEGTLVELDDKKKEIRIYICRTVVGEDEPEDEVDPYEELDHYITDEELEAERLAEAARLEAEAAAQAELDAKIAAGELEPTPEPEPAYKPRRNRAIELSLEAAQAIDPNAQIGDVLREQLETRTFGRIAAQSAKSVVIQAIREAERGMLADTFSSKAHQLLSGQVSRIDPRAGLVYIRVSGMNGTDADDLADAVLPPDEQVRGEEYYEGQWIKVYMLQVNRAIKRGPQVVVSRTHTGLVRRLMELEIPEISEGIVEIKSLAREPGLRTKVAVASMDPQVDPVGACIGSQSRRVERVVKELRGEKIDIIPYFDEPEKYVAAALAPAEIYSVIVEPGTKRCRVVAPDNQLSLAIGKEGKNAKLAAKLTGYKIDIRPSSEAIDHSSLNAAQLQQLSALLVETEAVEVAE